MLAVTSCICPLAQRQGSLADLSPSRFPSPSGSLVHALPDTQIGLAESHDSVPMDSATHYDKPASAMAGADTLPAESNLRRIRRKSGINSVSWEASSSLCGPSLNHGNASHDRCSATRFECNAAQSRSSSISSNAACTGNDYAATSTRASAFNARAGTCSPSATQAATNAASAGSSFPQAKLSQSSVGSSQSSVRTADAVPLIHQGCRTVMGPWKKENQDRVVAFQGIQSSSPVRAHALQHSVNNAGLRSPGSPMVYSAIFDGHGGCNASTHASHRLQSIIASDPELCFMLEDFTNNCGSLQSAEQVASEQCRSQHMKHLWQRAFSSLDEEILQSSRDSDSLDGCTALAGVHAGLFLVVANAGDSRAVLGRSGSAVRLTRDHKPELVSEKTRIYAEGGRIQNVKGVWRVVLPLPDGKHVKLCATSRGLGDRDFKDLGLLSCEPEVSLLALQPRVDNFTVFASDGLWDFVHDHEAVEVTYRVLTEFPRITFSSSVKSAADVAAAALVKLAQNRGSDDDISVVVNVYEWPDQKLHNGT